MINPETTTKIYSESNEKSLMKLKRYIRKYSSNANTVKEKYRN